MGQHVRHARTAARTVYATMASTVTDSATVVRVGQEPSARTAQPTITVQAALHVLNAETTELVMMEIMEMGNVPATQAGQVRAVMRANQDITELTAHNALTAGTMEPAAKESMETASAHARLAGKARPAIPVHPVTTDQTAPNVLIAALVLATMAWKVKDSAPAHRTPAGPAPAAAHAMQPGPTFQPMLPVGGMTTMVSPTLRPESLLQ